MSYGSALDHRANSEGVLATTDLEAAAKGADFAILVGGFPRKAGMERKDVMSKNVSIYQSQASAIERLASKNIKVLPKLPLFAFGQFQKLTHARLWMKKYTFSFKRGLEQSILGITYSRSWSLDSYRYTASLYTRVAGAIFIVIHSVSLEMKSESFWRLQWISILHNRQNAKCSK